MLDLDTTALLDHRANCYVELKAKAVVTHNVGAKLDQYKQNGRIVEHIDGGRVVNGVCNVRKGQIFRSLGLTQDIRPMTLTTSTSPTSSGNMNSEFRDMWSRILRYFLKR